MRMLGTDEKDQAQQKSERWSHKDSLEAFVLQVESYVGAEGSTGPGSHQPQNYASQLV